MRSLKMKIQAGRDQTSVCIWMKNESSSPITIFAPNPSNSVLIFDMAREPYSRVRGEASEQSHKSCQLEPTSEVKLTIDLTPYWDDVRGDCIVMVKLQITDEQGQSWEEEIKGTVCLNLPSFDEKLAEIRKRPRYQGPARAFDVSDSSRFDAS